MKIKVQGDTLIGAVKKLDGIEVVVENAEDAREALHLILRKNDRTGVDAGILKDFRVTAFTHYETSAVEYKLSFLVEFLFADDAPLDARVQSIEKLQRFFERS